MADLGLTGKLRDCLRTDRAIIATLKVARSSKSNKRYVPCASCRGARSTGLKEPDEGRYAEIGREMAVSNDWLIPHPNGFEHFQKPPLLYWATAASIRIFGATEWAARLPSALAATGVLLLTFWIGTHLLV
jgi:dolichyl-phosphate-mannose-protein mannosyltransferase